MLMPLNRSGYFFFVERIYITKKKEQAVAEQKDAKDNTKRSYLKYCDINLLNRGLNRSHKTQ